MIELGNEWDLQINKQKGFKDPAEFQLRLGDITRASKGGPGKRPDQSQWMLDWCCSKAGGYQDWQGSETQVKCGTGVGDVLAATKHDQPICARLVVSHARCPTAFSAKTRYPAS